MNDKIKSALGVFGNPSPRSQVGFPNHMITDKKEWRELVQKINAWIKKLN